MMAGETLGSFLRDRRTRLDPAAFGYGGRRRTPGLRREEVAQRAGISATWYSWLEQGRGGAPSPPVIERLAEALMLTEPEREHLFLLGLGRLPEVRFRSPHAVPGRLRRVLDALDGCPAIVRDARWDVIAWNQAAAAVLADYERLAPEARNILRLMFVDPDGLVDEDTARHVVAVFRADMARTGAGEAVKPLIDELCATSPLFARLWRESDVRGACEGERRLFHYELGEIRLEFSAFAVDGRPDLAMLVYTPARAEDADRVRALVAAR